MTGNDAAATSTGGRLERLMPLLDSDPDNLMLLSDAAGAALTEGRPDTTAELLDRYAAIAPLPPREANLAGLAAMERKDFAAAAERFAELIVQSGPVPELQFN